MKTSSLLNYSASFFTAFGIALACQGCGSTDENTRTTTWEQPAASSQLQQKIDSLTGENQRLRQQMDALSRDNRNLVSRTSDLELRLGEAMKQQAPRLNPSVAYEAALAKYRQKNFSDAAAEFEAILASGGTLELADNCHYWAGECYYGMRRYKDAIDHFQAVFNYVHAKKKADAQFMIGNCQLALGNKVGAITAFAKVINSYPTSELVKRAEEKLNNIR